MTYNQQFKLIYDRNSLPQVMDFLAEGFAWDSHFRTSLSKLVLRSPVGTPLAAISTEDGRISIALLLIYQGKLEGNQSYVINLSSWYALPSVRGVKVVNFARKLKNSLDDFVLTNYTPNSAAARIFKSVGFEPMEVNLYQFGLIKKFPFLKFDALKYLLKTSKRPTSISSYSACKSIEKLCSADFSESLGHGLFYSVFNRRVLGTDQKILNVYAVQRDLIGFGVWKLFELMVSKRALLVCFYVVEERDENNRSGWLYLNAQSQERFVSPVGSELTVIN